MGEFAVDAQSNQCELVELTALNSDLVERELGWLAEVINARLSHYFDRVKLGDKSLGKQGTDLPGSCVPEAPDLMGIKCSFADCINSNQLNKAERLLLILAITPHVRPQLLDVLWTKNEATGRGFTEFGGVGGSNHSGILPTAETALFLYAGDDLSSRFELMQILNGESVLIKDGIIQLQAVAHHEPWSSGALSISRDQVDLLTHQREYQPSYSADFPARRIRTRLNWNDLVLPASVVEQLSEIRHWVQHGSTLLGEWGMRDRLAPGFTSLFYGPPGTGKTLSASLLGKYCQREVYRIDLSMMVSKYIGETEKNLAKVFDAAENRNWILFFDEADALFGKRTKVESSNDRHANQEVSFLLQRIESFSGVIVLASNIKFNIDDSFIRRFQSVIEFPMPSINERLRLWEQSFPKKTTLETAVNLQQLASDHNLSGGMILNVVRFASLRALSRASTTIDLEDLQDGIRREHLKEGREI